MATDSSQPADVDTAARLAMAAANRESDTVEQLLHQLDGAQLRAVATILAAHADLTPAAAISTGPKATCELAILAAAREFDTTPAAIMGSARHRNVTDARAVAMTAAKHSGLSYPAVADHFDKDHSSVVHAANRVRKDPRLHDAAARITDRITSRNAATLPPTKLARQGAAHAPQTNQVTHTGLRLVPDYLPDRICDAATRRAAALYEISPDVIRSDAKHRAASDSRAIAMTAAHQHGLPMVDIATFFNRDRTSVFAAIDTTKANPLMRAAAHNIAVDISPVVAVDNGRVAQSAPRARAGAPLATAHQIPDWTPSAGAAAQRKNPPPAHSAAGFSVGR